MDNSVKASSESEKKSNNYETVEYSSSFSNDEMSSGSYKASSESTMSFTVHQSSHPEDTSTSSELSISEDLEVKSETSSSQSEVLLELKSNEDNRNNSEFKSQHSVNNNSNANEPINSGQKEGNNSQEVSDSKEETTELLTTNFVNDLKSVKARTSANINKTEEKLISSTDEPQSHQTDKNPSLSETSSEELEIPKPNPKINSEENNYEEDVTMPGVEAIHCPKAIMRDLQEPGFDVWRLDRDSMVDHLEYMYHDLGIARAWKIPRTTLRMFLLGIRERYQDNPYHNFKHCFCVSQMAYSMICKLRLRGLVSVDHLGALLTAAICHDVDHPGLNNTYHSHARTPLAILYNYQSILEQHHFAVACRILSNKERNIFRNVNNRDEVLTNVRELILATDLARHKKIMENYKNFLATGFNFKNSEHVMGLLKIIIKCADVSNEVRPETVAGPWVERLFAEYYEQSAREKREHLPVTSYMDPDMVNVSESQEGFIQSMMLPMYDELSKLMVEAQVYFVNPLYEALLRYKVQNLRAQEV